MSSLQETSQFLLSYQENIYVAKSRERNVWKSKPQTISNMVNVLNYAAETKSNTMFYKFNFVKPCLYSFKAHVSWFCDLLFDDWVVWLSVTAVRLLQLSSNREHSDWISATFDGLVMPSVQSSSSWTGIMTFTMLLSLLLCDEEGPVFDMKMWR